MTSGQSATTMSRDVKQHRDIYMPRQDMDGIHCLSLKLDEMANVLKEKGLISSSSLEQLAIYADINPSTLKSAKARGTLSRPDQKKLANSLKFSISDHCWLDPTIPTKTRIATTDRDYKGKDTTDNFAQMLRARKETTGTLSLRLETFSPDLVSRDMAVLEVSGSGQRTDVNSPLQVFLNLLIEPGWHECGLQFGFRQLRFRFELPRASRGKLMNRLGGPDAVTISDATLTARGGDHNPEWHIKAQESVLRGNYVTSVGALCELSGVEVGVSFEAELSVNLMESHLCRRDGQELESDVHAAVLKRLMAKRLTGDKDFNGWFTLGRQKLTVVEYYHE